MAKKELMMDASLLRESNCEMRLFKVLVEELAEPLVSIDIQFGSAFHHFAAVMVKTGGNYALAIKGAKEIQAKPCTVKRGKEYLTETKYLQLVCFNWWDWRQAKDNFEITAVDRECTACLNGYAETDNERRDTCKSCNGTTRINELMVEKNFKFKIYEDDRLIVWLCGTMDMLGKVRNGFAAISDYKTTAFKDEDSYFTPYQLSVQLRTYKYALGEYAKLYPGSIWEELNRQLGGCFIYGVFLEPPSSGKDTRFIRSDLIRFQDWEMDEYKQMLHKKVIQVRDMYYAYIDHGIEPMREGIINGSCDGKFGMCKFAQICMEANPDLRKHITNNKYVKRVYDPMQFGK